jgi:hypothetical protein
LVLMTIVIALIEVAISIEVFCPFKRVHNMGVGVCLIMKIFH